MKKIGTLLCFVFILSYSRSYSNSVSVVAAKAVALNFFKITYPDQARNLNAALKYTQTESDGSVDFYVFGINPKGFVIVAADDDVVPVLAYSNEADFNLDFEQCGVTDWMHKTAVQIHQTVVNHLQADERINHLWISYINAIDPGSLKSNGVGPLLTTS